MNCKMKAILKLLFLLVIMAQVHIQLGAQQLTNPQSMESLEPGKIRIKFKEESMPKTQNLRLAIGQGDEIKSLGIANVDKARERAEITKIRRVFPFSPKNEDRHRKYGLHLWYEFDFDTTRNPLDVIKEFEKLTEIDIIKPVYKTIRIDGNAKPVVFQPAQDAAAAPMSTLEVMSDSVEFNDPLIKDQWHYNNDGRFGNFSYDIKLFDAWQKSTGSRDIIIAIVDQGVDVYHEDLAPNIWKNLAELNGKEGVDDDQNGYVDDFYGWNFRMQGAITPMDHGTHVAGTVGAVCNNGIGVAGVAGGDGSGNGVKMISCQIFDNRASGGKNSAEAIVYGADNGAVISQNSWGYNTENYYEPEVLDAIRYFIAEAGQYAGSPMKGGVVFFAAGNTGTETKQYPGVFDEVITVASVGPTGLPSPFTTRGEWVDIVAPGGDMVTFGDAAGIMSTLPGDTYGFMEGTSMACPHVTGVAALIISKFGGAQFTAADLKRILLNSVDRFQFQHNDKFGRGYLNASRALIDDNRIPPEAINDLAANSVFHNEVRLGWTVPKDEDGSAPSYYFLSIGESPISASNFDNHALFQFDNNQEAGVKFEMRIGGLLKEKNYWFAIKSADQFDNVSEISNVLSLTTTAEPHFMTSTNSIDVTIDASTDPVQEAPLTFSNIGAGIVYWETLIRNEQYFREPVNSAGIQSIDLASEEIITEDIATTASTAQTHIEVSNEMLASASVSSNDHWKKDDTEFVAGLSYDNGTPPAILAGTGNPNKGLIFATRFDIPYNFSFNLTHLEAVLFPTVKDKPIVIEIKRGGRDNLSKAETVYLQEYYPDTTNQLKYYRIPIYKPQRFEDNESFWVVLHFPKEMEWPLVMQHGFEDYYGRFLLSRDAGRTFIDAVNLLFRPVIPMINALSTGNDGSFVFMEPNKGEIIAGKPMNANAIIDATNLSNGHHLASLGILTNDINKPIVNIEVKVEVTGQLPAIDSGKVHEFEVFAQMDNDLELEIENTGLGDLRIIDISSSEPGFKKSFTDTITISSNGVGLVPFVFQPSAAGIIRTELNLHTNIGIVATKVTMLSSMAPRILLALQDTLLTVDYGKQTNAMLKVSNTISNTELKYDLLQYQNLDVNAGLMPTKMTYSSMSSDDSDGPAPGLWEDISGFGQDLTDQGATASAQMDLKFPYFDGIAENAIMNSRGEVSFYEESQLVPLKIDGKYLKATKMLFHDFGDRAVFSFSGDIIGFSSSGLIPYGKNIEYQIVLYRNGIFEYRYKNVNDLKPDMKYLIWARGFEWADSLIYRNYGDPARTITNGSVIRFQPLNDQSVISKVSPLGGDISGIKTSNVILTIDPAKFKIPAGRYKNTIVVHANTPEKSDSVDLWINVVGQPNASVSQDSLLFDLVNIGQQLTKYAVLENLGADSLVLSSASPSDAAYSIDVPLPLTIPAHSRLQLPVVFEPKTTSSYSSVLDIGFGNGQTARIVLKGKGRPDPTYQHSLPSNIVVNLSAGQSTSIPFTVTNTSSQADLEYTFVNGIFSQSKSTSVNTVGKQVLELNLPSAGYIWKVSDSTRIFHQWFDIAELADTLKIGQGKQQAIVLPFKFVFFGKYYDTLWISKNGYVSVVEPEKDSFSEFFQPGDGISGMIAPFWSLLMAESAEDGVKVLVQADRVFLQWDKFTADQLAGALGAVTFQLEIQENGMIYFHYKNVEDWTGQLCYGLESPDEKYTLTDPKAIIVSYAGFGNSRTVAITPPEAGSISSGTSMDFNMEVSAGHIFIPGVHRDTVTLFTNSFAQPQLSIPIEIHVDGLAALKAPDSLIWREVVYNSGLVLRKQFLVSNIGRDIMVIKKIAHQGVQGLVFYNEQGELIVRNSSGTLLKSISILPWESKLITVEIPVAGKADINGSIRLAGNFDEKIIGFFAELVESPVFTWNATNQSYELNNSRKETYSFNISNQGPSTLKYSLVPAVIPPKNDAGGVNIVKEIGHYTFERPITIDSMALDFKEVGDGVFTPFIGGINLAFSNRFVAPAGGFNLSHIKTYNYLEAIGEYVKIMVYLGGELPQSGEKVYEQNFIVDATVDQKWIYFPLEKSFTIPEGETFYIIVTAPLASRYMGLDMTNDTLLLKNSFSGVYQGDGHYYWYPGYTQSEFYVWKIRPLTAAGKGQWIELDQMSGSLLPGESEVVTAVINPLKSGTGIHEAKILATSNDVNRSNAEVNITISVNGAPEFIYYPNLYQDTITIQETEKITLNYLFSDPENEAMTISLDPTEGMPKAALTQTANNAAQVVIKTNYDDAGIYTYFTRLQDSNGNVVKDSILLKVKDLNRPPVFKKVYERITLNLAKDNRIVRIDPYDLFSDPDGDSLQILVGNYNPEIVDMAVGNENITLHPLTEGTAQLIFGADDGHEDGFVLHYVYVIVINDPNAPTSEPFSNQPSGDNEQALEKKTLIYPNPVVNQEAYLSFFLEKAAQVDIELYRSNGQKVLDLHRLNVEAGGHQELIDMKHFSPGLYVCVLKIDNLVYDRKKVIVK